MSANFTVEAAERALVGRLAPAELESLPMISAGFRHDRAVRRRITHDVLSPRTGPRATGFDPSAVVDAVAPVVVVILNGVATQIVTDWAGRGVRGMRGRWRRRKAIDISIAEPAGADTTLPHLDEADAARVALRVRDVALLSGLSDQQAELMARLIAEMLMAAPVERSDAD